MVIVGVSDQGEEAQATTLCLLRKVLRRVEENFMTLLAQEFRDDQHWIGMGRPGESLLREFCSSNERLHFSAIRHGTKKHQCSAYSHP
jgi:hypothetical protein